MKILVVDDMASIRNVLLTMLKSIGYTDNDEATNGIQALNLMRKNNYDLLITDYHMPKLNGIELLKRVREDERLKHTRVLMVTCEDQREKIQSIIAAKVNGFILKPFTTNTLKNQISKISNKAPA